MSRTTRPMVSGARHVVSAGHSLAAAAAFSILESGGNAVDAGCAAGMALAVLQPDIVSLAGVAPIMIRPARSGEVITIDGLGTWPASLPDGYFLDQHNGAIPEGVERIVVPAAIDAWLTALAAYGTMSFRDVASSALRYAREGFAVHPLMAEIIGAHVQQYSRWPSTKTIFLPRGRVPIAGERFIQSDLASSLDYLCAEEAIAGGDREAGLEAVRAAFFRKDIARSIVDFVRSKGGFLSDADMAGFRSRVEPAGRISWKGKELFFCGPWCQGPLLAMALRQVDEVDIGTMEHNSPEYIHCIVEILKNVFADREYHFGDPLFTNIPLPDLLSREHARLRFSQIDQSRARLSMPPPVLAGAWVGDAADASNALRPSLDTSYVAVIDKHGNAFSATPSDASWDVPVVPGTGLVPSSRGSQSRPDPAHPAGARAGKRPRLTPNPAMILSDGNIMPFGTPGGDVQIQAMLQLLLNRYEFGMSLQAAVEAPRFATFHFPGSFAPFDFHSGLLKLESRVETSTVERLKSLGHRVETWEAYDWRAGGLCAVEGNSIEQLIFAGADPRRESYAIGS